MSKKSKLFIFVVAIIVISSTLSAKDRIESRPISTSATSNLILNNHSVYIPHGTDSKTRNRPERDDEIVVYEYGFEDGWDDWNADEPWEISDEDAHSGDFSAHCPVEANLRRGMATPSILIPDDGWQTYFQFWIHIDLPDWDPDNDFILDDYFVLKISIDDGGFEDVFYDYARDDQWLNNWVHYVPGTSFNRNIPEWRINQDLTRFAGQSIRLQFSIRTDDVMEGNQGTGLWIDDFEIITTDRRENDAGVEWQHIDYPVSLQTEANGIIVVKNFGLADQQTVRQFYKLGNERIVPIIPWGPIDAGSSEIKRFNFQRRLVYTGLAELSSFTQLSDGDDNPANDTTSTEIMIYPQYTWQLGYDDRRWSEGLDFDVTRGPAVLFTPDDDNVDRRYGIYAIEARWSSENQDETVVVDLTIYDDDDGQPGEELYSAEVEVTMEDLDPNLHYIDLADVDEIKNIMGNFWVSFIITREDHLPQIMGLQIEDHFEDWAEGHYYTFNGRDINDSAYDFQIHAILVSNGVENRSLEAQPNLLFGDVGIDVEKTLRIRVFGGGTESVTIEGLVFNGDNVFSVDFDGELPTELGIGETAEIIVTFRPEDEAEYSGELTFDCDDESPPVITLTGIGSLQPIILIEQDELDFGDVEVGEEFDLDFTVINIGLADLIISGINIDGEYFSTQFEREIVITPNDEEDLFVTFAPFATGVFEGLLRLISNDLSENSGRLPLIGFGIGGPEVRAPIPDIDVEEDFRRFALADLDTVFVEPEGDEYTFLAQSADENLIVELDDDNVVWVSAEPNWNGETEVIISADNGDEVAAVGSGNQRGVRWINNPLPHRDIPTMLTVHVTVNSVNDLPTSFNLLSPENGANRIDDEHIDFEWEESIDVIEESTITYIVSLTYNDTTVFIGEIEEAFASLTREELIFESDTPIEIEWSVLAFDGVDSLASVEAFQLLISALAVDEHEQTLLPTEVTLYPAAPNPFNSTTSIRYFVPHTMDVRLAVYDSVGRFVQMLSNGMTAAGEHRVTLQGAELSAGVYLLRLETGEDVRSLKMVLLK